MSNLLSPPPTPAWEVKAKAHCNRYELRHDLHPIPSCFVGDVNSRGSHEKVV
jgi:hypothetical protein